MKELEDLQAEVESGKVVFPLTSAWTTRAYKDDLGRYIFTCEQGFCISDSFSEMIEGLEKAADQDDHPPHTPYIPGYVLSEPMWQVLDTSVSDETRQGKTLFELRHVLEAGQKVYSSTEDDSFEQYGKDSSGFYYTSRGEDASFKTVDELLADSLRTHLPIWGTEKTPSWLKRK